MLLERYRLGYLSIRRAARGHRSDHQKEKKYFLIYVFSNKYHLHNSMMCWN